MGNLLDFIKNGGAEISNPAYNPKTKAGKLQPKLINSTNVQNVDNFGESIGNVISNNSYGLTQLGDPTKYSNYNVSVNPINTEAELNNERARNQGTLEQFGRMLGQAALSEVAIGSVKGFSDIADGAMQLAGIADNDYTNPVSKQLEDYQTAIRERLEIYRKNPDENFAIDDFGWWASNAVSIASSLSLLIPGTAISKLGKLAGVSKLARNIGKIAGKAAGKPNVWGKIAESGSDLLMTGGAMRVAENYIEARDTYKQVNEETLNKLNAMTDEEKKTLYSHNPKLQGLSNEDAAKYIAGESADDTFKDDMWLMLLDVYQLKGLKNMFKGAKNAAAGKALIKSNEKTAARLIGREIEKPKGIKRFFKAPDKEKTLDILRESSEAFEEGYQYIQQQQSIDKGRKAIDDSYQSRTYTDYIKDPQMLEQAMWGWLGGIAFQKLGSAAGNSWNKYVTKNKDLLTESRKAEIESRPLIIDKYINDINLLNQNYNPNAPILNDDGTILKTTDGRDAYEEINDTEKDAIKEVTTDKLITDLTINAIDKGNYDLLKQFLKTNDFEQYIDKSGVIEQNETKKFIANIDSKMSEIAEIYEGQLNKIINNDVTNADIASRIAKENTYNNLGIKQEDLTISDYDNKINKAINLLEENDIDSANKAISDIELLGYKKEIDYINKESEKNEKAFKSKKINRLEYNNNISRINKAKQLFFKAANVNTESELNANVNEIKNDPFEVINKIDKDIASNVVAKQAAQRRRIFISKDINSTNEQIRNRAKYIENLFNNEKDKVFQESLKELDNIYETNNINDVIEYLSGNKEVNINNETKEKLDIVGSNINILNETSSPFVDIISRRARMKEKEKGERPIATVNGEKTNTPPIKEENIPVQEKTEEKPEIINEDTKGQQVIEPEQPLSSPTGEQSQKSTNVVTPEIVIPEQEDKASKEIESVLAKQSADEEKQFNADSYINTYLIDNFLKNPNDELINLSKEEQYSRIKDELINQGYSSEIIDNSLEKQLSSINYIYNSIKQLSTETENNNEEEYPFSSLDLAIGQILISTDENKSDNFKNLIDIYKTNNNILSIDGKDYFNIISLMRFVIKESNATFETVDKLYKDLSVYLLTNTDSTIYNINKKEIGLSSDKLMELIQDKDREVVELDNNVALNKDNNPLITSAISSLKVGQKLITIVKPQGIEYNTIVNTIAGPQEVKIGFTTRAAKTKDNNGYIFNNGVISYELYYDENGYSSTLDNLFDKLNPQNGQLSDTAKEFIQYLYKNNLNTLTEEDLNNFWNNDLAKELTNNMVNKNTNQQTAKNILNTIGNIYFYNVSDNLDANYQSYINWIAKQYNNYKMVDTISNNKDKTTVTVKYISKGEVIFNNDMTPSNINDSVANFNLKEHHLGIIANNAEIEDVTNGNVRIKAGFNNRNMVVIIPNGTNEPHYSKIIPQPFNSKNELGAAIKEEITNSITERQQGKITFEELRDRLNSIFGIKNFVNNVKCIEYDNRLIISVGNSNIPILTIYKYKNDSSNLGTGITLNIEQESNKGLSRTGWGGTLEKELNDVINKILDNATYSMSWNIAKNNSNNRYIVNNENNNTIIKIGNKEFVYENYLDYIIKNGAGKIKLGKNVVNGVETNFDNATSNNKAKQQLKIEYQVLSPVEEAKITNETKRLDEINKLEQQGNQQGYTAKDLIATIAPEFADSIDSILLNEIIPQTVDIITDTNRSEYASYNTNSNKTTLYKEFFNIARNSQYKAVRTLVHEQLHAKIYANGLMQSEKFIDEMTIIRNAFINALDNIDSNQKLLDLIKEKGYNKEQYINNLRKVVNPDNFPNKSYNYMLEEFIVESLTSDLLNEALNNIDSTVQVSAETKKPNLWQKVINLIRELFNFGSIKDNTLLAQEFKIFSKKFKDINNVEQNIQQKEIEETNNDIDKTIETLPKIELDENNSTIDELASNATDKDVIDIDNIDDLFSSIDIDNNIIVPNMASISSNLNMSERTKFNSLLDNGEIKIYCK